MTIASTIYTDALRFIGEESPILAAEPEDQNEIFIRFQRLFEILPQQDIYLPMLRPASSSTDVREPEWATEALAQILARMVLPYFKGANWSPIHEESYRESKRLLMNKTSKPIKINYPSTLPRGSGNWDNCFPFFYPGQDKYKITYYDNRFYGESKIYTADFTSESGLRGTTVSSVTWSNLGSADATISNESTSDAISTARLTFGQTGKVLVRARATFANSEIYDNLIEIIVVDPESEYRDADYG